MLSFGALALLTFAWIFSEVEKKRPIPDNNPRIAIAVQDCAGSHSKGPVSMLGLPSAVKFVKPDRPCARVVTPELTARVEYFEGPYGQIRFLDIYARPVNSKDLTIWIVGGPRGGAMPSEDHFFYKQFSAALVRKSWRVLIPEYLGTRFRSRFPKSDINAAAREIISFARALRHAYPSSRIRFVAHSAGALVAVTALESYAIPTVLIAPPLVSIADIAARPAVFGLPPDANTRQIVFYATDPMGNPQKVTASGIVQSKSFVGSRSSWSLSDYLSKLTPKRRRCIGIVVGSKDSRIGLARLGKLHRNFPEVPVRIVYGMKHSPQSASISAGAIEAVNSIDTSHCS